MTSISLPMSVHGGPGNQHATVEGIDATHVMASTPTGVRKALKARVMECLQKYNEAERNYQRCVIGCNNGTVLIVRFAYGSWGYDIAGAGRQGMSHSSSTNKRFEDELRDARAHAEQSYGGVAWECR